MVWRNQGLLKNAAFVVLNVSFCMRYWPSKNSYFVGFPDWVLTLKKARVFDFLKEESEVVECKVIVDSSIISMLEDVRETKVTAIPAGQILVPVMDLTKPHNRE